MSPRRFIRQSFGIALALYVVRVTLIVRTFVAARLLGPVPVGAWNAIQLVIDNGALLLMGSQQGLDRLVPPRLVAGDAEGERRIARAALFNIVALTLVYAACCLVWVSVGRSRLRDIWGYAGMGMALLCVAATNLSNYQTSIQRSHGDFTTVGNWVLIQGAVGGGLGLVLLPFAGLWGLLGGWLAGSLAAAVYTTARSRRSAPLLPAPAADGLTVVQVGFPLFVFMTASLVMRQLDRLIVLRFLGVEMLGYYGLAVMVLSLLLYFPDSVAYVLYPRLQREFAAAGEDETAIRETVVKVLRATSLLVPAISAVAFLVAGPAVRFLLPKFLPGVTSIRVLCFGAVGLAYGSLASIVLMTVGRQTLLMPAAILSMVAGAGLDLLAVRLGYGINGVAWATLATYSASGAMLLSMALTGLALRPREVLGLVTRLYVPLVVSLAIILPLGRIVPWAGDPDLGRRLLRFAISTVVFTALYLAVVNPLARGLGLRQVLSDLDLPVVGGLVRRLNGGVSPQEEP